MPKVIYLILLLVAQLSLSAEANLFLGDLKGLKSKISVLEDLPPIHANDQFLIIEENICVEKKIDGVCRYKSLKCSIKKKNSSEYVTIEKNQEFKVKAKISKEAELDAYPVKGSIDLSIQSKQISRIRCLTYEPSGWTDYGYGGGPPYGFSLHPREMTVEEFNYLYRGYLRLDLNE